MLDTISKKHIIKAGSDDSQSFSPVGDQLRKPPRIAHAVAFSMLTVFDAGQ
jgi:hypothetical protein